MQPDEFEQTRGNVRLEFDWLFVQIAQNEDGVPVGVGVLCKVELPWICTVTPRWCCERRFLRM